MFTLKTTAPKGSNINADVLIINFRIRLLIYYLRGEVILALSRKQSFSGKQWIRDQHILLFPFLPYPSDKRESTSLLLGLKDLTFV